MYLSFKKLYFQSRTLLDNAIKIWLLLKISSWVLS